MDWLDLLAVQGTLKSLLQHHSSKASILRHSAFFIVQLSHPYMTTGKTIALTRWTFVGKVVSLLFNIEINEDFWFLMRKYAVFYVPKALLGGYSTVWDMWLLSIPFCHPFSGYKRGSLQVVYRLWEQTKRKVKVRSRWAQCHTQAEGCWKLSLCSLNELVWLGQGCNQCVSVTMKVIKEHFYCLLS